MHFISYSYNGSRSHALLIYFPCSQAIIFMLKGQLIELQGASDHLKRSLYVHYSAHTALCTVHCADPSRRSDIHLHLDTPLLQAYGLEPIDVALASPSPTNKQNP